MRLSALLRTVRVEAIGGLEDDRGRKLPPGERRAITGDSLAGVLQTSGSDPGITSIHYRAQDVERGGLFVAIKGLSADGHAFIPEAVARGASAIIVQEPIRQRLRRMADGGPMPDTLPIAEVGNTREALARISAAFFKNPSEALCLVAITGTNGKTTSAWLVESILTGAGLRTGVIGTHNYRYGGEAFDNPRTTPEALDLQRILAEMLEAGTTHVVMEVTSHGIDLHRIDACRFDVGVFTNLSQDHLDYHGDMDAYWSCKKRLFTDHLVTGPKKGRSTAVINCMDQRGRELSSTLADRPFGPRLVTIGQSGEDTIRPEHTGYGLAGIKGRLATPSGAFAFESPLPGEHNLENILCAVGVGIGLHVPLDAIKTGIETAGSVPGRLEPIPNDRRRYVYVDYAHTPDALERVLGALRSLTSGRIICVFGCGGGRDQDKRAKMGEVAARLCDFTVLTSDNPRSEDPEAIIRQICDGIKGTGIREYRDTELRKGFRDRGYSIDPDRRGAIRLGLAASREGDTVLIAGKGNEAHQVIGEESIAFDDRQEAREALSVSIPS